MSHKVRVSALAGQSQKASLGPAGISPTLFASDVPPKQFVEMRVVFPKELLASTGGARVEPGDGLQEIMDQGAAEKPNPRPARHGKRACMRCSRCCSFSSWAQ